MLWVSGGAEPSPDDATTAGGAAAGGRTAPGTLRSGPIPHSQHPASAAATIQNPSASPCSMNTIGR